MFYFTIEKRSLRDLIAKCKKKRTSTVFLSLFGDEEQGDRIKKAPFHVHLRKREFDVRM
ncbi:hypothetical protein N425_08155 [Tannerella sp. oral taxon BU063 isolate Cell 2]|uniref:Uncharacterized protein n=1 Tax=Tannerella sp. oral taxon BU063 isolate Cell 2 TaxID=1411148 RepID=W2C3K3_9BACT|nr:hypothetical protein N425_08155 [Tannerella sp. oral taxon BU063 isolate Cell 2]